MEFASKYVFNYGDSDEESVSDEEFCQGMSLSESDSDEEKTDGDRAEPAAPAESKDSVDSTTAQLLSKVRAGNKLKAGQAIPLPPPPLGASSSHAAAPTIPPAAEKKGDFMQALFSKLSWRDRSTKSVPEKPPESKAKGNMKTVRHWKRDKCPSAPAANYSGDEFQCYQTDTRHRKRFRRADTNVVSIKFEKLISPSHMHTGDAEYCRECKAILSRISKLEQDGENKVWTCEFCGERNLVDVMEEEIPQIDDVTFMLEPAVATTASGPSGTDESFVIFCVDVSGSMCVTTQVPGKMNLRGSNLQRLQSLNRTHEDQHLPGERRNVTYISRLQAMQAAVDHQLNELVKSFPHRRVALISFNNEVEVIGDGSQAAVCISGDKLKDKEALVKAVSDIQPPKAVKDSGAALSDKVFGLEEGGATALGPALTVAVAMASQCPGSKVIVCTDGMANVGLGSLENLNSEEDKESAGDFYTDLGQAALAKSVSISVISITGSDCKLAHLGQVAELTGGQVNIVDPLKLTEEFSTILAGRVIATNVVATFLLHKKLYIRDEEQEESKAVKVVGNVTADTEVTFEYGIRRDKDKKKDAAKKSKTVESSADSDIQDGATATITTEKSETKEEGSVEYPFQLQIQYTDTEGAKALRVFTQKKPVTNERQVAESDINLAVLGTHTAQTSAQLAMAGAYSRSRGVALMNQRLAWRYRQNKNDTRSKVAYKAIFKNVRKMENQVNVIQQNERHTLGSTYSDEEDEEEEAGQSKDVRKARKKKMLKASRTTDCPDDVYLGMYDMRHANMSKLSKK